MTGFALFIFVQDLKRSVEPLLAMSPIVTEKFSDLVGAIYDCALGPPQWPKALSAIQNEFGFVNTCLSGVHPLTAEMRLSRTHFSRVLSKTGCGRQAELAALSSRIPMFA